MLQPEIDAYVAYRSVSGWSATYATNTRRMLRRIRLELEAQGHRHWSTVGAADLDAILLADIDRGLSRGSVGTVVNAMRGLGAWLTERGRVLRNPAAHLSILLPDQLPLPPAPLSEAQVAVLFAAIPRRHVVDLRDRLHLELLYACALRSAEAIHLDVGDLDLNARTVRVRNGKMGRSRLVPLLGSALTAASEYLALRRELLRGPDRGTLLLNQYGRRIAARHMRVLLRRLSQTLGFRVHPHLLRHSIAVHLLRRGTDIRHIQAFLGHSDLDTTKIYLRLVPGHLREDYDAAMPALMAEVGS
jgi:integrase/recombinase XerD